MPKSFRAFNDPQEMAELGFIVVQIDGMGTSNRSKAFHDVCWKNLGDAGFPDRILWMKAAAEKYPYMDLSRVGIYGGSAGGQNALRAVLAHGDFYKAAAADCGCHDNRMDKIWWNELWMGWPVGPHYAEQSNVTQAHKLTGKLLLTVGELDRNVDPASTMQVVNALIRAGKDFELVVVPGANHGAGGSRTDGAATEGLLRQALARRSAARPKRARQGRTAKVAGRAQERRSRTEEGNRTEADGEGKGQGTRAAGPGRAGREAGSEARILGRHYDADRGAFAANTRSRPHHLSMHDCGRFMRAGSQHWTSLDSTNLSAVGSDDVAALRKRVETDLRDLETAATRYGEIALLLPFAAEIVSPGRSPSAARPDRSRPLAAQLTELGRYADRTREAVEEGMPQGPTVLGVP